MASTKTSNGLMMKSLPPTVMLLFTSSPVLRAVRKVLAPGGTFFLSTPNATSLEAVVLGTWWSMCKVHDHVSFPSPTGLAVAARGNKALATFIPMGFGAGVGRVGPYYEQGNWFRGGAVQMLFMMWLRDYGFQTGVRPMFSEGTSQQDLIIAAKSAMSARSANSLPFRLVILSFCKLQLNHGAVGESYIRSRMLLGSRGDVPQISRREIDRGGL